MSNRKPCRLSWRWPVPYQSKLDSLKAQLEQHQASLQYWTSEATRFDRLVKKGNVSREDKDRNDAKKAEAKALVDVDKAGIENAELDLSFTKVTGAAVEKPAS